MEAAGQRTPSDYVFELIAGLGRQDSLELFRTINSSTPSPSLEQRLPTVRGKRGRTVLLTELQTYSVTNPLVFALLHRCFIAQPRKDEKRITELVATRSLKNLASFVMRTAFVAPKFESSRFEAAFANTAKTVFDGADIRSLDILEELERNDERGVINDGSFIRQMSKMELYDDKACRFLFGINFHHQTGSDVLREDRCSVEHILPQSETHWRGWTGFKDVNADDWVHRTGNLVVVSRRENRPGVDFNRNFMAKARAFKDSPLLMPRTVASTYNDWTPQTIEKRSYKLAEDAAATWRFSRGKGARRA